MAWADLTEVDRLVIERWSEVRGLIEAYHRVQDRMEERIGSVQDHLDRWAKEQGFEIEVDAKRGEILAYSPSWVDKRRGAKVCFVVGAFCPIGYRKVDVEYPYMALCTSNLENFKIRRDARLIFAESLAQLMGDQAKDWHDHGADEAENPLWRDLKGYDEKARCVLASDPDKLYEFAVRHLPQLFQLSGAIGAALEKLPR